MFGCDSDDAARASSENAPTCTTHTENNRVVGCQAGYFDLIDVFVIVITCVLVTGSQETYSKYDYADLFHNGCYNY